MLDVQNLKRLGLGPLALSISAGECVALTGPSGAGKSLLLRAIADIDPNTGVVTLAGEARDDVDAAQWRATVIYVPANAGWWADTVQPHFAGCDSTLTRDLLHAVNLETTALGWEVARLSTGERQRLALVRAMARQPRVLLLDEPTSGLDDTNARNVEAVVKTFCKDGGAVMFVSHDTAQAQRLGERVLVLEHGTLHEATTAGGVP